MTRAIQPELLWTGERWLSGHALLSDASGRVTGVVAQADVPRDAEVTLLRGKAVLPGMVNAHSHSFQRLLRGRAERAVPRAGGAPADFWSWRDVMYASVLGLSLEDIYDVARMCFLEMLLAGITTVGEFHYVHRQPDGSAYPDGNAAAKEILRAAASVGIRIVLLRSAYLRSGFGEATDPGQRRFFESTDEYLRNMDELLVEDLPIHASIAAAPHSLRAVPLADLHRIAAYTSAKGLPMHMHVAEQRRELDATVAEYGATPVALLAREGLLRRGFTAVHATHVSDAELDALAAAGSAVCVCPTTERNLGDGIFDARAAAERGIPLAFGSDSQAQIGPLEDARQLEYHLRLRDEKRLRLEGIAGQALAPRLYAAASQGGADALGVPAGRFLTGEWADAAAFDLAHISLAGAVEDDLLSAIVLGSQPAAVTDVFVGGRPVVRDGNVAQSAEVIHKYGKVAGKVWS